MFVTTYSDARNNFASVLDRAKAEGNVVIVRADGSEFNITPRKKTASPFAGIKQVVHLKKNDFAQLKDDIRNLGEERV